MKPRLFFFLPISLLGLASCGAEEEMPYTIDRNGDLLYSEAADYGDCMIESDAETVLSMVDKGQDVMLSMIGTKCYYCIQIEPQFVEYISENALLCYSFTNEGTTDSLYNFIQNASSVLVDRYGLENTTIATPSLYLLKEDGIQKIGISASTSSTASIIDSLVDDYASYSNLYFFHNEEAFLSFTEENDGYCFLLDEENESDMSLFYEDFYQNVRDLDVKSGVYFYQGEETEVLNYFGIDSYSAYIEKGGESRPLSNGSSLL